jgi:hypothetical protein
MTRPPTDNELRASIALVLEDMPADEAKVLRMRFGIGTNPAPAKGCAANPGRDRGATTTGARIQWPTRQN